MKMEMEQDASAQATIWNYIYGFSDSMVLRCAVDLDIANIIHDHAKPITLPELASKLPVQPVNSGSLYRVMRHLVHMELFTKTKVDGEMVYGLAPPAQFLVKGEKCMVNLVLGFSDKDLMSPWHYIKDAIAGETAFEKALGMEIWTYLGKNEEKSQLVNEIMACDTKLVMSAFLSKCKDKFIGITSLVDVAGGTGTAVWNIAKAFPHIKCILYDLPHVIADSSIYPEIDRVAGDMFKYIPSADAILMKYILHDYDNKKCIQILKKCKEAVPEDGGKVIIIDIVLNVDSKHPYSNMRICSDLDMMLTTGGGKERTLEEWNKLFKAAGYRSYNVTEISAVQSVIEAFPY